MKDLALGVLFLGGVYCFLVGLVDLALIFLGAIVVLWVFYNQRREGYGGMIKNIKKVPFNDCVRICDTFYQTCMATDGQVDPGKCYARFKESCPTECVYSSYERL